MSGVGNVTQTQSQQAYKATSSTAKAETTTEKKDSATTPVDTYTPSKEAKGIDKATLDKLWNQTDQAANALKKMVATMLGKKDASGQAFWSSRAGGNYKLSDEDRAEAEKMVGEDGFFGVKQTTNRIMDFAKALVGSGADEGKIDEMRDAVQKGFDEVARMFGGFDNLPDVTKQTYDSIMGSFDEWKSSASTAE